MAPTNEIHRLTLFKIEDPANVDMMMEQYQKMHKVAVKPDGKQYIKHIYAGKVVDDPRNQGYNLAVKMCFASQEDMDFYDKECKAHADLKAAAKGKVNPPTVIFYPGTVSDEL